MDTDTPHSERYVTLKIPAAGIYTVTMTGSAGMSIELIACDESTSSYSHYGTRLDEAIELTPGRKRLMLAADIAGDAAGEVVLRRAPPLTPVTAPGPPSGLRSVTETPPDPRPAEQAQPKRDGASRAPRRGAVTSIEATTAAQRAVPAPRACTDIPRVVTAELDIVRGRGVVTALNLHIPAPDDPRYP